MSCGNSFFPNFLILVVEYTYIEYYNVESFWFQRTCLTVFRNNWNTFLTPLPTSSSSHFPLTFQPLQTTPLLLPLQSPFFFTTSPTHSNYTALTFSLFLSLHSLDGIMVYTTNLIYIKIKCHMGPDFAPTTIWKYHIL